MLDDHGRLVFFTTREKHRQFSWLSDSINVARPKGCGLVQMASIADAHSAIDNLNNCLIDGRRLEVRYHVL